MNNSPSQLALREWRSEFTSPVTLVTLLGVSVVLTLVGPFGSDENLGVVTRFGYWLVTVVLTYGAGSLVHSYLFKRLAARSLPYKVAAASLATTFFVVLIVFAMNWITFGYAPTGTALLQFVGTVFGVVVAVSSVLSFAATQTTGTAASAPERPALLDRLPLEKRGRLLALTVEDHYVRVQTSKGEELILMRLSDAMREVGDTKGAQVHRSHWVSFDAVASARRQGDRAILTLTNKTEIPVSRANVPTLKEAGLLPR